MAYIGIDSNGQTFFSLISSVNGFGLYRYDTLDPSTDVDGNGYFNNLDDTLNLGVGDIIEVVSWTTAVRTGTVNDVSRLIVLTVVSNDSLLADRGSINTSDDIYVTGIVSSTD